MTRPNTWLHPGQNKVPVPRLARKPARPGTDRRRGGRRRQLPSTRGSHLRIAHIRPSRGRAERYAHRPPQQGTGAGADPSPQASPAAARLLDLARRRPTEVEEYLDSHGEGGGAGRCQPARRGRHLEELGEEAATCWPTCRRPRRPRSSIDAHRVGRRHPRGASAEDAVDLLEVMTPQEAADLLAEVEPRVRNRLIAELEEVAGEVPRRSSPTLRIPRVDHDHRDRRPRWG